MKKNLIRSPLVPKMIVILGLFLGWLIASPLDSTQADSVVGTQFSSSPETRTLEMAKHSKLKSLLKEQKLDLKIFVHLQKSDLSGFKAAQDVQLKEWESNEKKIRHKFFSEHPGGAERRSYIQDFMKRREDLFRQLASDKAQKTKEQSAQLKEFREGQEDKVKKLTGKSN